MQTVLKTFPTNRRPSSVITQSGMFYNTTQFFTKLFVISFAVDFLVALDNLETGLSSRKPSSGRFLSLLVIQDCPSQQNPAVSPAGTVSRDVDVVNVVSKTGIFPGSYRLRSQYAACSKTFSSCFTSTLLQNGQTFLCVHSRDTLLSLEGNDAFRCANLFCLSQKVVKLVI